MELTFEQQVKDLLHCSSPKSALFHAEQYYACMPNERSAYSLATVLYQMRNFAFIVDLLVAYASTSLRCANILAWAYFEQRKYVEALKVLTVLLKTEHWRSGSNHVNPHEVARKWCLEGLIHKSMQNMPRAVECFRQSVAASPLMFEAVEELAALGKQVEVDSETVKKSLLLSHASASKSLPYQQGSEHLTKVSVFKSSEKRTKSINVSGLNACSPSSMTVSATKRSTRSASVNSLSTETLNKVLRERKRNRNGDFLSEDSMPDNDYINLVNSHQEASARYPSAISSADLDREEVNMAQVKKFASTYCEIVDCLVKMYQYRQVEALPKIRKLCTIQNTSCVRRMLSRCFSENIEHQSACEHFEWLLNKGFLIDMSAYSTTLWHLKSAAKLSALTHSLMETNRESPHAWCALGNSFSLQRRHEDSITGFERAIKIDETFGYGHNLLGHEYMATESYDNALLSFRKATKYSPRLYNAWYGLGLVYYRQEKWVHALAHFEQAIRINPSSPILRSFKGMSLHKLGKLNEALHVFEGGIKLDERNPQILYRKATVLIEMERFNDALNDLLRVAELVPNELNVYYRIGNVYAMLGDKQKALSNYLRAMTDGSSVIKEAIDRLAIVDDPQADLTNDDDKDHEDLVL